MNLTTLTALSPLDGRYRSQLALLNPLLSEYGLIYYRCYVEIHWLIALAQQPTVHPPGLSPEEKQQVLEILTHFNEETAQVIKSLENETNHDVKAVEYFLQKQLANKNLDRLIPLIHFGCTSEDINNLSYALMFKQARDHIIVPKMTDLIECLKGIANETCDLALLSRTHGQPASPTTLGKEIANAIVRLERQKQQFINTVIFGKWNGAVGNFNAHRIAYPEVDWLAFNECFVTQFRLSWNEYTTQIEPHDWLAESFHALTRFNTVLIDLNRNLWGYISLEYFTQKPKAHEVGSSTMPHKINPIDFENSEGNLGLANALAQHCAEKLPISRWQRDLSDSTVLRNLGSILGYSLIAYQSHLKGLKKLSPNPIVLQQALENHWEVLCEAVQSVMRRYHIADAYEQLKAFSRGKPITAHHLKQFIKQLPIPDSEKERLLNLTPAHYIGYAADLCRKLF